MTQTEHALSIKKTFFREADEVSRSSREILRARAASSISRSRRPRDRDRCRLPVVELLLGGGGGEGERGARRRVLFDDEGGCGSPLA